MTERDVWLAANRSAVERRLAWLGRKGDGVIFVEPAGPHFVVVTKTGSRIRLVLAEQVSPRSDLTQAYMDLNDPFHLVSPYLQAMMVGLVWTNRPRRIYMAGLGGGRLPMVLYHYLPDTVIDCAEIDPMIVRVAERFFGVCPDERLRVAVEDGRVWLAQAGDGNRYEMILVDVFLDNGYSPYRLATLEFYELCKRRLAADGVLVANMMSTDPFYGAKIRTMEQVFDQVAVCPAGRENQILFASQNVRLEMPDLVERAEEIQMLYRFSFPFVAWAESIELDAAAASLDDATVLRDGAPPEGYFDTLPSFDGAFGRTAPELPCPCGSGHRFSQCHGRRGGGGRSQ